MMFYAGLAIATVCAVALLLLCAALVIRHGRAELAQSQALRSKRQDVDAAFSHLVAVMGEPYRDGFDR